MNGVDRPWRAYDLEQFIKRYEKAEKGSRDDLLIIFPKLWESKSFYLDITRSLLNSLDPKRYRSIRIRPYPSKKEMKVAAFEVVADSRVTVSPFEESVAQEAANSRIVLHVNVPTTSFLEAVSVDHPSVGLLMNEYPTDIVKPYYQWFQDNGVLHSRIESVATHLNDIDIGHWWGGIKKSEEYIVYKERFAGYHSL